MWTEDLRANWNEEGLGFENEKQQANNPLLTVTGTLKGYDALMNLVLDDVDEVVRGTYSLFLPLLPPKHQN
jgi:hypothetical protein